MDRPIRCFVRPVESTENDDTSLFSVSEKQVKQQVLHSIFSPSQNQKIKDKMPESQSIWKGQWEEAVSLQESSLQTSFYSGKQDLTINTSGWTLESPDNPHWLSFEFIRNCDEKHVLLQIIRELEVKGLYQSLLHAARKRFLDIEKLDIDPRRNRKKTEEDSFPERSPPIPKMVQFDDKVIQWSGRKPSFICSESAQTATAEFAKVAPVDENALRLTNIPTDNSKTPGHTNLEIQTLQGKQNKIVQFQDNVTLWSGRKPSFVTSEECTDINNGAVGRTVEPDASASTCYLSLCHPSENIITPLEMGANHTSSSSPKVVSDRSMLKSGEIKEAHQSMSKQPNVLTSANNDCIAGFVKQSNLVPVPPTPERLHEDSLTSRSPFENIQTPSSLALSVSTADSLSKDRHSQFIRMMRRIDQLEKSESDACRTIQSLKSQIDESAAKSRRLERAFGKMGGENEQLKRMLQLERLSKESACKKNTDLRQIVSSQLKTLQDQLESNFAREESIRRQYFAARKDLAETQKSLNELRNERNIMLTKIQEASCDTVKDAEELNSDERRRIVDNFVTNAAATKAAIDATAKALVESGRDLQRERQQSKHLLEASERRLHEAMETIASLERELANLAEKLNTITNELIASRSAHTADLEKWKKLEASLKDKILNAVTKNPNMVPMALFRRVKDASESRLREIQVLQRIVDEHRQILAANNANSAPASSKVAERKNISVSSSELKGATQTAAPNSLLSERKTLKVDTQQSFTPLTLPLTPAEVTPYSHQKETFGTPIITGHSSVSPPQDENASQVRLKIVRKVGGRKGLQEKLKQMRSPPIRRPFQVVN